MDLKFKKKSNVSTTLDVDIEEKKEDKGWTIENLYKSELTVDSLIETLNVVDILKRKYPNDETIFYFDEIVREELCNMFGGTLKEEESHEC